MKFNKKIIILSTFLLLVLLPGMSNALTMKNSYVDYYCCLPGTSTAAACQVFPQVDKFIINELTYSEMQGGYYLLNCSYTNGWCESPDDYHTDGGCVKCPIGTESYYHSTVIEHQFKYCRTCVRGYYGLSVDSYINNHANCTICPNTNIPGVSPTTTIGSAYNWYITGCFIETGTQINDGKGDFTFTDYCHYKQ